MQFFRKWQPIFAALGLLVLAIAGPARAQLSAQQTWAGTAGGTSTALTLAVPNVSAFADLLGVPIRFLPSGINNSSVQVNVSNLGLKNVLKQSSAGLTPFTGNEFQTGQMAEITWDGTEFVWTTTTASASAPMPQVYLTPCKLVSPITGCTAGVMLPTGDVLGATVLYAEPVGGNLVPIWNGNLIVPTPVTEAQMTLTLGSNNIANVLYDVCIFNNGGTPTIVTTPAWSTSTLGAANRGTGANTPQITKVNGLWVNAVQINGLNGGTTYSAIPANQCTVIATILIDGSNGQVSFYRTYGSGRRWAVANIYNRQSLYLRVGNSASFAGNNLTLAFLAASPSFNMIVVSSVPEETYSISAFVTALEAVIAGSGQSYIETVAVGLNSTSSACGYSSGIGAGSNTAALTVGSNSGAQCTLPPFIGANQLNFLEKNGVYNIQGGENNNLMLGLWRG